MSASRAALDIGRAVHQLDAALHVVGLEPAAFHCVLIVLRHGGEAAVERLARGLDDRHRYAGVCEAHGDAAPHGAGADYGGALDLARLGLGRGGGWSGTLAASRSAKKMWRCAFYWSPWRSS